jgi:hypothetical protein
MRTDSRRILLADPIGSARMTVAGVLRTIFGPGTADWASLLAARRGLARYSVTILLASYLVAILILGLIGLVVAARSSSAQKVDRSLLLVMVAACAYLVLVGAGPEAYSRFRHPIMPVLCLLAAVGASSLLHVTGAYRRR